MNFIIESEEECRRLDHYLPMIYPEISRSAIQKMIQDGQILVNNEVVKSGYALRIGDVITGKVGRSRGYRLEAENLPLDILFEDDDLIVINKQAGLVVHPAPSYTGSTLINALLYHCNSLSSGSAPERPGIVHRLDRDTSGLMIIAKNDMIHQLLCQDFKDRTIEKFYLALVWGSFENKGDIIDLPIGRDPKIPKKFKIGGLRPKPSITIWERVETFDLVTLLKLKLVTGRTHQIRVHLSGMNHPVVGDLFYGRDSHYQSNIPSLFRKDYLPVLQQVTRQLLHAYEVIIHHPRTGELLSFRAPLPVDFDRIINQLQAISTRLYPPANDAQ